MKKIFAFISFALLFASVSCIRIEKQEYSNDFGTLSVDMTFGGQTKAMSQDQLINNAKVNIYKADYSGLVRSYTYWEIPSPLYLAADSYRVDVIAGEAASANPALASWENKSYMGSKEFEIKAGLTTSVQVLANVNNAVTNVSFDQTVAENFNIGYTFTIGLDTADAATQLTYNASKSGAEGYFIVVGLDEPSFTWTFTGTLKKDGSKFTKTGTIKDLIPGKMYKMNLKYTVKDGDLSCSLVVDYTTDIVDDTIIFEPVSTGLASSSAYEIWAAHATLHADVDPVENKGASIQFAYSHNASSWITVNGVNDGEGMWKADINGLIPSTTYTYRLLIDGERVGSDMTFTTEAAPKIPNGSFEYVSKVSGKNYYKFYDPDCGVEEGSYMFWGSGNGEGSEGVNGSANMGIVITTVDTGSKVHGKQSVCAETSQMVGILAAGNLFTGQFAGLIGTEGGMVNFGRPWTSRPTALKLYCKYSTGKMDIIKRMPPGVTLTKSDYDCAQVKVALGTWNHKTYGGTKDSPVQVNTTLESTFIDFYTDKSTIANGDVIIYNDGYSINKGAKVTAATTEWIEYVIPIDYRNLTTYPTHIVISCASSMYGDYFTGYSGAKLWIDDVELIYE